jgi:hypothetical protein
MSLFTEGASARKTTPARSTPAIQIKAHNGGRNFAMAESLSGDRPGGKHPLTVDPAASILCP